MSKDPYEKQLGETMNEEITPKGTSRQMEDRAKVERMLADKPPFYEAQLDKLQEVIAANSHKLHVDLHKRAFEKSPWSGLVMPSKSALKDIFAKLAWAEALIPELTEFFDQYPGLRPENPEPPPGDDDA